VTAHPLTPDGPGTVDLHAPNPVHDDPRAFPGARWDRRNTGEGVPEVATPMTASWTRLTGTAAQLRLMHLLGAVTEAELGGRDGTASPYHQRLSGYFYGRRCLDATATLGLLGRLPGVDAADLAEYIYGERLTIDVDALSPARTVRAIGRLGHAATTLPRRIERRSVATAAWWAAGVAGAADASWERAVQLLDEASERMRADLAVHAATSVFHTAFANAVNKIARRHLDDEEMLRLHGGVAEMSETTMLARLRAAARGGSLTDFQRAYGFYTPSGAELMTRSWREDVSGLTQVLAGYAESGVDPAARHLHSQRAFGLVRTRLLREASHTERAVLRPLLDRLQRFAATRERSKAMVLQCTDASRAAVRRLGWHLWDQGRLDDPDDVFFLTVDELGPARTQDSLRSVVAARRDLGRRYADLDLPFSFDAGSLRQAVDRAIVGVVGAGAVLSGLGLSAGTATGRVVVMRQPSISGFEAGDILVCQTTDPGWSALLSIAGAVVMDMASALSHGAIVARELGLPCVGNVVHGTRQLQTGQIVRVNGTTGVVEVLAPVD